MNKSCKCRPCTLCCCEPRSGGIFVGIANLVAGTLSITAVYLTLSQTRDEMLSLEEKASQPTYSLVSTSKIDQELDYLAGYYWSVLLAYAFPSLLTFLVGISVILATAKGNEYLLLISLLLTGIQIFVDFTIGGILYWIMDAEKNLWAPLVGWGSVQLYFAWILIDFRSTTVLNENEPISQQNNQQTLPATVNGGVGV